MRKVLCGALCFCSLATQAEPSFDFYMGVSAWYTAGDGGFENQGSNPFFEKYSLQFDKEQTHKKSNAVFFAALEHTNRFLPDILIQHNNIKNNGESNLILQQKGSPSPYPPIPTQGEIDLSHTDITLYYHVLNDFGPMVPGFLDLGLTTRILNGELDLKVYGTSFASALSTTYALLYVKTGINMPLDGLSLGMTLNGGYTGKESSSDASLYMQYETPDGLGVHYGYRYFNTDISAKASTSSTDQTFDIDASFDMYGPFLSIYYHL